MSTTTPDEGATTAQPDESAAVTTGYNADQVITTDDQGTPSMVPVASPDAEEAAPEAPAEAAQAPASETVEAPEEDVKTWAEKKGLPLDDPVKLATMYRDAEKKMHQATEKAKELETATVAQAPIEYTGNPQVDSLAEQVNTLLIKNNVQDFFSNHPEARGFEPKMAEIVTQRPHLQNDLDALYALARTDPSRETDLIAQGGREALTNLAQKQSAIPPGADATNSGVFESQTITPGNVYELVDKHDQAWFEKNHEAISKAMSG